MDDHHPAADPLRKLSENESWRLGMATGAVEQVAVQPLMYWKNARQQGLPFTLNPRLLYRGMLVSVGNTGLTTATQAAFSGYAQKAFAGVGQEKMTWSQEVGAGFLGGFASGPINGFMELILVQQQRFGGNMIQTPWRLMKQHGLQSWTRGWLVTSGREGFYAAGYLGTVPATQKLLSESYGCNPMHGKLLGALIGGLLCALVSQPLDTAKTCMQGDVGRERYGSLVETMKTLRGEYGSITALGRGYGWRAALVIIDFVLLDSLIHGLAPIMFPDKCG